MKGRGDMYIPNFLVNNLLKFGSAKIRNKIFSLSNIAKNNDVIIAKGVWMQDYRKIKVDSNVFINANVKFYTGRNNNSQVIIGKNTGIGMETIFMTATHEIGSSEQRMGTNTAKSITIGNGVWIGGGGIILPGADIGDGCIIQAGSVVKGKCKSNCIYAGNPAEIVKELT